MNRNIPTSFQAHPIKALFLFPPLTSAPWRSLRGHFPQADLSYRSHWRIQVIWLPQCLQYCPYLSGSQLSSSGSFSRSTSFTKLFHISPQVFRKTSEGLLCALDSVHFRSWPGHSNVYHQSRAKALDGRILAKNKGTGPPKQRQILLSK